MRQPTHESYGYEVGGSLSADSPTYVVRAVDEELYGALRDRQLCYILNARQMGKSSLRVRIQNRLQAEGIACADVDLSLPSSEGVTAEQWYAGVADALVTRFDFYQDFDFVDWWITRSWLPPTQRLGNFFEEILLARVPGDVILFFDEIDSVLSLSFRDDFFALLRSFFERRASQPDLRRLTFVLVGVATPSELIRESHRSPFNIGRAIALEGFRLEEAAPALLPGLTGKFADPEMVLREVLRWTGGQPFLTQKLCKLTVGTPSAPVPGEERDWIENLVRTRIVVDWHSHDEPPHLRTIRDRLLSKDSERAGRLLGLYQRILEGREQVSGGETPESVRLRLSGLVVEREGALQVANLIYAAVFGPEWVAARMAELRPYAPALASWLASDRTDNSRLLSGEALESARTWAAGRSLSDEDYKFLEASGDLALQAERQANQLLAQARSRAQRRIVLGSVVLALTILGSFLTLFFSWRQVRQAKAETANLQKQAGNLQIKITNLAWQKMESEAESFVEAIGQRPDFLPPAELKAFQRLAGTSEDVRMEFLRQALASDETAKRLMTRIGPIANAVIGLDLGKGERVMREFVLPCLRESEQALSIQQLCADLGVETGVENLELNRLVLDLTRKELKGVRSLPEAHRLVHRLAAISTSLPPSLVPDAFSLAVRITEKVDNFNERAGNRSGILKNLGKIASALPHNARESAFRRVGKALLRTRGSSKESKNNAADFWAEVMMKIPGDFPPDHRSTILKSAWSYDDPGAILVLLARRLRSSNGEAAFREVVARASAYYGGIYNEALLEEVLEEIAAELSPEAAGAILVDLIAEITEKKCFAEELLGNSISPAARRADARSREQAQVLLLTLKDEALAEPVPGEARHFTLLHCMAYFMDRIPGKLPPGEGREILSRLIKLQELYGLHVESPMASDLAESLRIISKKTETADAEGVLLPVLKESSHPYLIESRLNAIGELSGQLSLEASQLVVEKISEMSSQSSKVSPLLWPIAQRLAPETAHDLAPQILAMLDRPQEVPWWGDTYPPPYRAPVAQFNLDEFSLAAEVLSVLPQSTAKASSATELWPVIRWGLACKEDSSLNCSSMEKAIRRLPGNLDLRHAQEILRALSNRFDCSGESGDIFEAIIAKVDPAERGDAAYHILAAIDTLHEPSRLKCLLAGLVVAQPSGLNEEQVRRAFVSLGKSSEAGLGHRDSLMLKDEWLNVAQHVMPSKAHTIVHALSADWEQGKPGKEWTVLALPVVAGRVLPKHSREVFMVLVHASSLASDPESDQAIAESLTALPGMIPPRDLLNFLQQPQCVGALRSATLARLERETGRKFDGSLWKAVDWARKAGIDLESRR